MGKETKENHRSDTANGLFNLEQISEIARRALKDLISRGQPAIPPFYEKAFYNVAAARGETDLMNHLISFLPTGQAASLMVSEISSLINALNSNIHTYREGLVYHDSQIADKHSRIKALVAPEIWSMLEKDFLELRNANQRINNELMAAEEKLKNQEEQVLKLEQKIRSDPLTGVFNRQAMEEDLSSEFSRSKRYKKVFGIVMADIDHFKKVNDTYGHAVGDEVLKSFAKILKKCLREVDVIYRFGGEEFLILMPETHADPSLIAALRLQKKVESHVMKSIVDSSLKLQVTASFGVSVYKEDDESYQDIMQRADQALYMAKDSGRNRVEMIL